MIEFVGNIVSEIEVKAAGTALLNDYKRLLFENEDLKHRVAELQSRIEYLEAGIAELIKAGETIYCGRWVCNLSSPKPLENWNMLVAKWSTKGNDK